MATYIIELEKFLAFCDACYTSLNPCNCGKTCTNNNFCQKQATDCYDCIKRVHDYHNSSVHYNCLKMLYCYVLKHGYRFSAEILFLFQRIQRDIVRKEELYVTSIGCGPCTELFGGIFFWRSIGKNNASFHFRGFDLEPLWAPLMMEIPRFFNGADVYIHNFDAFEYYKTTVEKIDVLVLNYMLSDMLKFHSQEYSSFLSNLCELINRCKPRYLLINDIYLLVSKNATIQLLNRLQAHGISFKYVTMQYPGINSFIGEFGRQISKQPFEMFNKDIVEKYDPFRFVNSIQAIVVFQ